MLSIRLPITLAIITIISFFQTTQVFAVRTVKIGLLLDIQKKNQTKFVNSLREEIKSLLGDKYKISIPENKIKKSLWSPSAIMKEYESLIKDKEVHIIIAAGVLNAAVLSQLKVYPKPLMLLGIMDAELQGIKLTSKNKSGVNNLTYLLFPNDFMRSCKEFKDICDFQRLVILLDQRIIDLVPGAYEKFEDLAISLNIEYTVAVYKDNIPDLLKQFPSDCDGVLFAGLYKLGDHERMELISEINNRKLPSYSFRGTYDVEKGILAGAASEVDFSKASRRMALNIEKILAGLNPSRFPTLLTLAKQLTINMETAHKIGFSPKWSTIASTNLINEDAVFGDRLLDFKRVANEALVTNLTLNIEQQSVKSATAEVDSARSELRPFLGMTASANKIDSDSAGAVPEKSTGASLVLNQVVYSHELAANLSVKKHLLNAANSSYKIIELDTVLDAGKRYLNILRARTEQRIQKNYLTMVKKNYKIAKRREEVGYSGAADVYRWQSEQANARIGFLRADNNVRLAKIQLNEFLQRPINELFAVKDIGLDDKIFSRYGGEEIRQTVNTPVKLEKLTVFLVNEAIQNSPEIVQIKESMRAQKEILASDRKKRYTPIVNLQTQADKRFSSDWPGAPPAFDNDSSWGITMNATWSFYEGGGINADVTYALSELEKLRKELTDTTRKIEVRVRNAILDVRVKSANIGLTSEAEESSNKNYKLVLDSYSQGTVSIVTLLDAQNAALRSQQSAANSVYEYFISVLTLERSFASFAVVSPPEESEDFFTRLKKHMDNQG